MTDYRDIAKNYIDNGYWVIPTTSLKQPAIKSWSQFQSRPMTDSEVEKYFKRCFGIAILAGGEPRVFILDIDLKYSLSHDFFDRLKEVIPNSILSKAYVQKTTSGGYHFIYKVPKTRLRGNEKWANRHTTAAERHKTYMEMYTQPRTMDIATKVANNDRSRVILETRSGADKCGGYAIVSPTKGYEKIYGTIGELSEEEYDTLEEICRGFNEVSEFDNKPLKTYDDTEWETTPWDDYNERGDTVDTLLENGWEIVSQNSSAVRFKRPGGSHSASSGLYDIDTKIFFCFSTSTIFEVRGYNPVGVFSVLECDNDMSMCYKKLIEQGFGAKG